MNVTTPPDLYAICPECNGFGGNLKRMWVMDMDGHVQEKTTTDKCSLCEGKGNVDKEVAFEYKIRVAV